MHVSFGGQSFGGRRELDFVRTPGDDAIADGSLYVTIDEKPKRPGTRPLKRLRNMMENPSVAFVADRYDEDWRQLAWIMLRGRTAPIPCLKFKSAMRPPGCTRIVWASMPLSNRYAEGTFASVCVIGLENKTPRTVA